MSESAAKTQLPIWAKLSLFIFFACLIIGFTALAFGAAWVARFPAMAHDPASIAKVVQQFGDVQTPLPQGFAYEAAFSVPILAKQCIIIRHDADHSIFWFIRIPNPSAHSPELVLRQSAKRNPLTGRSMEIKQQGTETVAGQKMVYLLGSSGNQQQMISAIEPPKTKKEAIVFIGMNSGGTYNMETTRQLLGAIKSLQ